MVSRADRSLSASALAFMPCLCLLALPLACGESADGDAEATAWRLTEELRIGTALGDGPEAFGRVVDLLADEDGRVYVLDAQAQEIRIFGPDGDFLHAIGREGQGPGEFDEAIAMGWGPEGELRVIDLANGRVSSFWPDGELIGSKPIPGGFFVSPWPGAFLPDGGLITVVPGRVDGEFRMSLVRYDSAMAPVDTLARPEFEGEENYFEIAGEEGGGLRAGVPYSASLVYDLDPSGFFWVARNTARYRIEKISFDGDTLLRIERPFERAPLTGAEIDSAVASMRWFSDQGGRIDRSKFPDRKPTIQRIFGTATGHLMVEPVTDEFGSGFGAAPSTLDVFDASGPYLGALPLPAGFRTAGPEPVFLGEKLYAVVRDELDVSYVVQFAVGPRALAD